MPCGWCVGKASGTVATGFHALPLVTRTNLSATASSARAAPITAKAATAAVMAILFMTPLHHFCLLVPDVVAAPGLLTKVSDRPVNSASVLLLRSSPAAGP